MCNCRQGPQRPAQRTSDYGEKLDRDTAVMKAAKKNTTKVAAIAIPDNEYHDESPQRYIAVCPESEPTWNHSRCSQVLHMSQVFQACDVSMLTIQPQLSQLTSAGLLLCYKVLRRARCRRVSVSGRAA